MTFTSTDSPGVIASLLRVVIILRASFFFYTALYPIVGLPSPDGETVLTCWLGCSHLAFIAHFTIGFAHPAVMNQYGHSLHTQSMSQLLCIRHFSMLRTAPDSPNLPQYTSTKAIAFSAFLTAFSNFSSALFGSFNLADTSGTLSSNTFRTELFMA